MRALGHLLLPLLVAPATLAQTFTDVASSAGLSFADLNTSPSAWRDYDGDGDQDLFLAINGGSYVPNDVLAQNDGTGHFLDVAAAAGVQGHANLSFQLAAAWGDYDNDGDADLFVTNTPEPYQLFRNDGNGTFTDVAALAGLTVGGSGGKSVAWADVDDDGWLDLLVTVWGSPNRLFHNLGNGTFVDVAVSAGVAHGSAASPCGVFCDYDADGDLDLLSCSVDSADPTRLFRNEGNLTFTDVTASAGLAAHRAGAAIWADLDDDGDFDLYVSDVATGSLIGRHYRNQGNGTLADAGIWTGLRFSIEPGVTVRSASVADYDEDGHLDVYVTTTNTSAGTIPPVNRLFHNDGSGYFVEVAAAEGVACTRWAEGSSWADFDDDGDLDLFVANDWPDACRLYRNDTAGAHWVKLSLEGTTSNRDAVGAVLHLRANGAWQTRQVDGGGTAMNCQDDLPVEFGLGSATLVELLEITWPSGLHEVYEGLAADTGHHLVEGNGAGCPPPVSYCVAAPNSVGAGAHLSASGTTSVAANDLVLHVVGAPPGQFSLFFYGLAQTQVPFYDGWRCVAGGGSGLFRIVPTQVIDGSGSLSRWIDREVPPMNAGAGALEAGDRWNFQLWYRDPSGPGGTGGNTSDALSVLFCL